MRIKRRAGEEALSEEEIIERRRRIEAARELLSSYRLCLDMLNLRKYERKRAYRYAEEVEATDLFEGNEVYWRARMNEISSLISAMRNSREKVLLYYHYIRGESIEHVADHMDVSRRTGYRLHERGLHSVGIMMERIRKGTL